MLAPCVSLLRLPAAGLQNRLLQLLLQNKCCHHVVSSCAESPQAMRPVLKSVHCVGAPSLSMCAPASLGHELAQWMPGQPLAKQGFIYMYGLMTSPHAPSTQVLLLCRGGPSHEACAGVNALSQYFKVMAGVSR